MEKVIIRCLIDLNTENPTLFRVAVDKLEIEGFTRYKEAFAEIKSTLSTDTCFNYMDTNQLAEVLELTDYLPGAIIKYIGDLEAEVINNAMLKLKDELAKNRTPEEIEFLIGMYQEKTTKRVEEPKTFLQLAEDSIKHIHHMPTGFKKLDSVIGGGLVKGRLYIIAGRPGTFKSSFAANIAYKLALRDTKIHLSSLEMESSETAGRIMRAITKFGSNQDRLEVVGNLKQLNNLKISSISSNIRDFTGAFMDDDVIIIDQLSFVEGEKQESNHLEIHKLVHAIKRYALQEKKAVILLCQLNRDAEKQDKPTMSSLAGSDGITQAADVIIALERDECMVDNLMMHIVKNRQGRMAEIPLKVYASEFRLEEIEEPEFIQPNIVPTSPNQMYARAPSQGTSQRRIT